MEVSGTATSRTNCEGSCKLSFCTCRKCSSFFMTDMYPLNIYAVMNRINNAIQRIPDDTIDPAHPRRGECFYNMNGHCCHLFSRFQNEVCLELNMRLLSPSSA